MKHHILVKWNNTVTAKDKLADEVACLFNEAKSIEGIHNVNAYPNCINRPNRYDLMIVLDMDESALCAYDDCECHHTWKDKYGSLIEKKAIFDCNG
jgi:hypothetical protein